MLPSATSRNLYSDHNRTAVMVLSLKTTSHILSRNSVRLDVWLIGASKLSYGSARKAVALDGIQEHVVTCYLRKFMSPSPQN
jgi:hypothetical protein